MTHAETCALQSVLGAGGYEILNFIADKQRKGVPARRSLLERRTQMTRGALADAFNSLIVLGLVEPITSSWVNGTADDDGRLGYRLTQRGWAEAGGCPFWMTDTTARKYG